MTGCRILFMCIQNLYTIYVYCWWRRRGSNPRPSDCEPDALPAELRPHVLRTIAILALWGEDGKDLLLKWVIFLNFSFEDAGIYMVKFS